MPRIKYLGMDDLNNYLLFCYECTTRQVFFGYIWEDRACSSWHVLGHVWARQPKLCSKNDVL